MILRTSGCAARGHSEITVVFRDEPVSEFVAGWILDHLQDLVARGRRLEPGNTVRLGMRTLRMIARGDGTLGVEERTDDRTWGEHVDRTMTDLWYQSEAAAKLGLPEEFSSVSDDDPVAVQPCSEAASTIVLNRVEPDVSRGYEWLVRCDEEHEHEEWVFSELSRVLQAYPHLARFFALPVGIGIAVPRAGVSPNGSVLADVVYQGTLVTPGGGMRFGPEPIDVRATSVTAHAAVLVLGEGLYRSSIGARRDHPEIVVRVADPLVEGLRDAMAGWLLDYLQDSISEGTRFESGQRIQIGWRTVRVIDRLDGLGLLERDDDGWDENVGRTLRDLWYQREVVASLDLTRRLSFPSDEQSASVAACVAEAPAEVVLDRSETDDPASSGWTIVCALEHDHGALVTRPLADVVETMPFSMQFLALPVGSSIAVQAPDATPTGRIGVRVRVDRRVIEPLPGSYLAALAT